MHNARADSISNAKSNDWKLPKKKDNVMPLDEKQKETLNQYYKELKKYNEKRKQDKKYWKQYYKVLKKIKYLIRYGKEE